MSMKYQDGGISQSLRDVLDDSYSDLRKPRKVLFFINGNLSHRGKTINITPNRYFVFHELLSDLTRFFVRYIPNGVRRLFDKMGQEITDLNQLENNSFYICSSTEPYKASNYDVRFYRFALRGHAHNHNLHYKFFYTPQQVTSEGYLFPEIPVYYRGNKSDHAGTPRDSSKLLITPSPSSIQLESDEDNSHNSSTKKTKSKPKILTIIFGKGKPYKYFKILLDKTNDMSYEELLSDISGASGTKSKPSKVKSLVAKDGTKALTVPDLYNKGEIFIALEDGNPDLRPDEIKKIIAETIPYEDSDNVRSSNDEPTKELSPPLTVVQEEESDIEENGDEAQSSTDQQLSGKEKSYNPHDKRRKKVPSKKKTENDFQNSTKPVKTKQKNPFKIREITQGYPYDDSRKPGAFNMLPEMLTEDVIPPKHRAHILGFERVRASQEERARAREAMAKKIEKENLEFESYRSSPTDRQWNDNKKPVASNRSVPNNNGHKKAYDMYNNSPYRKSMNLPYYDRRKDGRNPYPSKKNNPSREDYMPLKRLDNTDNGEHSNNPRRPRNTENGTNRKNDNTVPGKPDPLNDQRPYRKNRDPYSNQYYPDEDFYDIPNNKYPSTYQRYPREPFEDRPKPHYYRPRPTDGKFRPSNYPEENDDDNSRNYPLRPRINNPYNYQRNPRKYLDDKAKRNYPIPSNNGNLGPSDNTDYSDEDDDDRLNSKSSPNNNGRRKPERFLRPNRGSDKQPLRERDKRTGSRPKNMRNGQPEDNDRQRWERIPAINYSSNKQPDVDQNRYRAPPFLNIPTLDTVTEENNKNKEPYNRKSNQPTAEEKRKDNRSLSSLIGPRGDTVKINDYGNPIQKPSRTNRQSMIVQNPESQRIVPKLATQLPEDGDINDVFDIGRLIATGNFSEVMEAKKKKDGNSYAVKIIDKPKLKNKEDLIEEEIRILRSCDHPNIMKLKEQYESPQKVFLVSELVKEGDLFDAICENIKFTESQSAVMMRDLCRALFYLHSRGLVHRDIKPENLLVVKTNGVINLKLADFGLAVEAKNPLFVICGTATYVAPEILTEQGYGKEVDLWAAGVVAYILICGFPPFRSADRKQTELFEFIKAGEFEYLSPYWDNISTEARDLIDQMIVIDPRKRYSAIDTLCHPWILTLGNSIKFNTPIDDIRNQARVELQMEAASLYSDYQKMWGSGN